MGERMAALEGLLLEKTASAKAVLNRALGSWPPIALPAERGHPQSHGTGAPLVLTPIVDRDAIQPSRVLLNCRHFRKGLLEEKAAGL